MIARMNKKGFTLLELLAVFAIIFIILTFTVPKVLATINNSKTEADIANLDSLNRATEQYKFFLDIDNQSLPEDLTQQILLEEGFVNDILEPNQVDKEFLWDSDLTEWILSDIVVEDPGDGASSGFDLSDDQGPDSEKWYYFDEDSGEIVKNEDYEERLIITGEWTNISDDNQDPMIALPPSDNKSDEGTFSINHGLTDSYTITVDSEIVDKTTVKDLIFGVYFESSLQDDEETAGVIDEKPSSGYQFKISYSTNNKDTNLTLEEITGVGAASPIDGKQTTLKDTVYEKLLIKIDVIQNDGLYIYVYNENNEVYSTSYLPSGFEIDTTKFSGVFIKRQQQHTNTFFLDINISPY